MDTAIDKIATIIVNALEHCYALRRTTIPYSILVIPMKSKPIAKRRIKNPAANTGNAMTIIPNIIVKTPRIILPICEDFGSAVRPIPTMTLSIPSTNNVTDKRSTKCNTCSWLSHN
jgi:hypothetical protein